MTFQNLSYRSQISGMKVVLNKNHKTLGILAFKCHQTEFHSLVFKNIPIFLVHDHVCTFLVEIRYKTFLYCGYYLMNTLSKLRTDQDQSLYPHNHGETPIMMLVSDPCGTSLSTEPG